MEMKGKTGERAAEGVIFASLGDQGLVGLLMCHGNASGSDQASVLLVTVVTVLCNISPELIHLA